MCDTSHTVNNGVYQDRERFAATLYRIMRATRCESQVELANFLGIRQSAISAAKRDGIIPDAWLLELSVRLQVSPYWILTGDAAPCANTGTESGAHQDLEQVPLEALLEETARRIHHMRELYGK